MTWSFDEHASPDDRTQHALTLGVMRRLGVPVERLWLHYSSMGGDIGEYEVDAYLHGLIHLPAIERDMLSQAVNELLDDITRGPRAPYSTDIFSADPDADLRADLAAELAIRRDAEGDAEFDADADEFRFIARPWVADAEELVSVVYSSVATQTFSDQDLTELLRSSRHTNGALHLTGLLLHRKGRFLQVLEGPERAVHDRMSSIASDPRHTAIRLLTEEKRRQRQFPHWTMGFEPISASLSNEVPDFERTFTDIGQDDDLARTVRVTKDLVHWFQRNSQ